jgi:hypothetical protein
MEICVCEMKTRLIDGDICLRDGDIRPIDGDMSVKWDRRLIDGDMCLRDIERGD